jgi:hypothetical protein
VHGGCTAGCDHYIISLPSTTSNLESHAPTRVGAAFQWLQRIMHLFQKSQLLPTLCWPRVVLIPHQEKGHRWYA